MLRVGTRLAFATLVICFILGGPAYCFSISVPCDRWISLSGDDSANGNQTSPWKTLRHAASLLNQGNVLCFSTGVYSGDDYCGISVVSNSSQSNMVSPFRGIIGSGLASTIFDCGWETFFFSLQVARFGVQDDNFILSNLTVKRSYAELPAISLLLQQNVTKKTDFRSNCLLVTDTLFSDNLCTSSSNSSLSVVSGIFTTILWRDSAFKNNTSVSAGMFYPTARFLNFTRCMFQGNKGGVLALNRANATFSGCTFTLNSSPPGVSGGVLALTSRSNVTIDNCTFQSNFAAADGGALSCSDSEIEILGCLFDSNKAEGQGGGILSSNCFLSVTDSSFSRNSALYGGSLFTKESSKLVASGLKLERNRASFGAAVFFSPYSIVLMTNSIVSLHEACFDKGPLVFVLSNVTMRNCSFYSNKGLDGGAINMLLTNASLFNCTMFLNSADSGGGAISAAESLLEFVGGVCSNNVAPQGGCIQVTSVESTSVEESFSKASFRNITFNSNHGRYGGAIAITSVQNVEIIGCIFDSNNSSKAGGSIFVSYYGGQGSFRMIESKLFNSTASGGNGGGLYLECLLKNYVFVAELERCDFWGNSAPDGNGGAVILLLANVNIHECNFYNNSAALEGGGIFCSESFTSIADSVFDGNIAMSGGGIFLRANIVSNVTKCCFSNCLAGYGGGIMFQNQVTPTDLWNCSFLNNTAQVSGAAFFCFRRLLDVLDPLSANLSFASNAALGYGSDNATQPTGLRVFLPGEFSDSTVAMFPPSTIVSFEAALVDAYGNFVNDDTFQIFINVPPELTVQGSVPHNEQPARGIVSFNLSFSGGILFQLYNCSISASSFEFPFSIGLTRCGFGKINQFGEGCRSCNVKELSFDSVKCIPCPSVGPFPCAYATISNTYLIEEGFYVLPSLINPMVLVACPRQNETSSRCLPIVCSRPNCTNSSCPTTCQQTGNLCSAGYTGARCTQCLCDSGESCYFRGFSDECIECKSTPQSLAFLIVGIVVGVALFVCIIVLEQSNPVLLVIELIAAIALVLLGVQGEWFVEITFMVLALTILATTPAVHNGAIKILLFYVQVTNVLVRNRLWPGWFEKIAQKINIANIQISGLECINREIFTNEAAAFALQMAFPWILIICVALIVLLRHLIRPCTRRCRETRVKDEELIIQDHESEDEAHLLKEIDGENEGKLEHVRADLSPGGTREMFIKTVIFVLYVGYFELTNQILAVFNCAHWDLPDLSETVRSGLGQAVLSQTYMEEKPWIMCDLSDPMYRSLFIQAVLFSIVYVVGIPLCYAFLLWRNRKRILHGEHIPWLAFLFEDYKTPLFWFELLWMGRRVLISLFVVVISRSDPFQPFFVVLILSASLAIEMHLRPFKDKMENALEALVLITLLGSYGGSYGSEESQSFFAFQWYVAVINSIVLCILLIAIFWPFFSKIRDKARNCKRCKRK